MEIFDLPIKHGDSSSFFVCLPVRVSAFFFLRNEDKKKNTAFVGSSHLLLGLLHREVKLAKSC